jgi:serine/threonine protein kinase
MSDALRNLKGMTTADGWLVGELIKKQSYQTGGAFSVGYLASHPDGREGFLKALDFSRALSAPDTVRALEIMTRSYNFERDVLALCRASNLNKIVVAIADGEISVPAAPFGKVFYLIFELADGDIRLQSVQNNYFNLPRSLRALHHVSTGLAQLHKQGIYHQDVKPSNVLLFSKQKVSKLADLGRSHCNTIGAPHDNFVIAGVRYYAPPEQLYNYFMPDRNMCRAAADLYLLGSLLYYFYTGAMLTPVIVDQLRPEHRPSVISKDDRGWQGSFSDVLPYIKDAYAVLLNDFKGIVASRLGDSSDREAIAGGTDPLAHVPHRTRPPTSRPSCAATRSPQRSLRLGTIYLSIQPPRSRRRSFTQESRWNPNPLKLIER